jgi:hypothetical protein
MVRVAGPPPERAPDPIYRVLSAGSSLVRLFNPASHGATALSFRSYGPLLRFDHHRGWGGERQPTGDPERGIYYAALSLSSCLVEIFGDTGVIDYGEWHVAMPHLARDLRLLDLRGAGAMRAGSVAALAKVPDPPLSQAWSRYFYENEAHFPRIDGLSYFNAHNDEEALALYERAADALDCPDDRIIRLDHGALRPAILAIAERHSLILAT